MIWESIPHNSTLNLFGTRAFPAGVSTEYKNLRLLDDAFGSSKACPLGFPSGSAGGFERGLEPLEQRGFDMRVV